MPDSAVTEAVAATLARRPPDAIRWREEMAGGLNGALVAFPIAVPLGALAFAPLGPRFAGIAVAAALVSAALGGLAASLLATQPQLRSGPVTAVCLVVNTLLAGLVAVPGMAETTPAGVPRVVAFAFACVLLAGLLQIAFGMLRLGQAIKFVPRPVLAGFRNGLGILIALAQLPPLLGLSQAPWRGDGAGLADALWSWNLVVGGATVSGRGSRPRMVRGKAARVPAPGSGAGG